MAKCLLRSCFNSPLSSEFPNSGRQKRERPVELELHFTVSVNAKYTLDLIFKREKAGYLTNHKTLLTF